MQTIHCQVINCDICSETDIQTCTTCKEKFQLEDGRCDNCEEGYDLIQDVCITKKEEKVDVIIGVSIGILFIVAVVGIAIFIIVKNRKEEKLNKLLKTPLINEEENIV